MTANHTPAETCDCVNPDTGRRHRELPGDPPYHCASAAPDPVPSEETPATPAPEPCDVKGCLNHFGAIHIVWPREKGPVTVVNTRNGDRLRMTNREWTKLARALGIAYAKSDPRIKAAAMAMAALNFLGGRSPDLIPAPVIQMVKDRLPGGPDDQA